MVSPEERPEERPKYNTRKALKGNKSLRMGRTVRRVKEDGGKKLKTEFALENKVMSPDASGEKRGFVSFHLLLYFTKISIGFPY